MENAIKKDDVVARVFQLQDLQENELTKPIDATTSEGEGECNATFPNEIALLTSVEVIPVQNCDIFHTELSELLPLKHLDQAGLTNWTTLELAGNDNLKGAFDTFMEEWCLLPHPSQSL